MRKQLLILLVAITPPLIWFIANQPTKTELDREAYQEFIYNHPFNEIGYTAEQIDAMPKKDRPDLAMQQNYLMTLDPNTREVPTNRLVMAYEQTKAKLAAKNFNNNTFEPIAPSNNSKSSIDTNTIKEAPSVRTLYESYQEFLKGRKNGQSGSFQSLEAPTSNPNIQGSIEFPEELEGVAIANVVWNEKGPDNIGGRTRALMWDPNDADTEKLWAAGVAGGIWYNNNVLDPNSSWQAVNDFLANMAVTSIAYDPTSTTTFYAGTGEGFFNSDAVRGAGIFKSTDGGDTWAQLPSTTGSTFHYVQKVVVTGTGTVLAATREGGGIQRSTDGGTTWTSVLNGSLGAATSRAADIEIAANGDIYATMGIFSSGSIHRSTNDGATWVDVSPGTGSPQRIELAIAPSASSTTGTTVIYAVASNGNNVEWFQRSTDGGANWTNLTIPEYREQNCSTNGRDFTRGQAWYDLILSVKPDNPDVVLAGGINILRSSDGGTNMAEVTYWTGSDDVTTCDDYAHADQHAMAFRPGFPSQAVFGHDGGISYSPDVGVASNPTFDSRNKNYAVTQFYSVAAENTASSAYFLAGAQDNGTLQLSAANGLSAAEVTGGDGGFCFIDQDDNNFQISSFVRNVYYLLNATGGFVQTLVNDQNSGRFINPADYDNTANILYSAGNADELKRISGIASGSPSAQETLSLSLGGGQISNIRADANQANRIFVGTDGGNIYRIDNAESVTPTVTDITGDITTVGFVSSIDVGATDNDLIVTFSNFGVNSVWYSTNGGTNWTNKDDAGHGLPDIPVRWALFNPTNNSQVLLATELGVWSTNDITAANPGWEPTNTGLANVRCDMLQYRAADGLVVVGTHGRGIYTTDIFVGTPDNTAPTLLSLNPTNGDNTVGLDPTLELVFDEAIKVGTGNITVRLATDDTQVEAIDVTSDQVSTTLATASITLSSPLAPNVGYYVEVDAGTFTDNFDNPYGGFTGSGTWSFTTFDGDLPPVVVLPIDDQNVLENSSAINIDLTTVFDDPDNDNNLITFQAAADNNAVVTLDDVSDGELTITIQADRIGDTQITITATSNGKMVDDVFNVNVAPNQTSLFVQSRGSNTNGQLEGSYIDVVSRNADDFTIPAGQDWAVNTVQTEAFSLGGAALNLQSVIVEIYDDNAGTPGTTLFEQTVLTGTGQIIGGTDANPSLTVKLNTEIPLVSGTYWISIFPQFNATALPAGTPTTALYAWYQQAGGGNSVQASSADGAFAAINQGLGFSVLGTQTINDAAPVFDTPIADLELAPNAAPVMIDLNNRVSDADNDDALITFEVFANTNTGLVTTGLVDRDLTLTIAPDTEGSADITIRATSNGLTVDDTFTVTVEQPSSALYSQTGAIAGSAASQFFPDFGLSLESADNFSIPNGEIWNIRKVSVVGTGAAPAQAFVIIYDDNGGNVGAPIFTSATLAVETTSNATSFELTLQNQTTLGGGNYWISVQTNQAFAGGNQWFWNYASPAVNGDYQFQDLAGVIGGGPYAPSGNDGALIFDILGGTCDAPTGLAGDNITENSVDLTWTDIEADSYIVTYRRGFGGPFTAVPVASTSTTLSGLDAASLYQIRVASICGGLTTLPSPALTITTSPSSGCGIPAITSTTPGMTTIDVAWDDSFADAEDYIIEYRRGFGGNFSQQTSATSPTTLTGLVPSSSYQIRVRSVCSGVVSQPSAIVSAATLESADCGIPAITSVDPNPTTIEVAWDDSFADAEDYIVEYRRGFGGSYTQQNSATSPITLMGLVPASNYQIRVRSVCSGVVSQPSAISNVATSNSLDCGIPAITSLNPGSTTIDVAWDDSFGDAEDYIVEYRRGFGGNYTQQNSATSPITLTGLVPSSNYQIRVRSICNGVVSQPSSISNIRTLAAPASTQARSSAESIEGFPEESTGSELLDVNIYPNPLVNNIFKMSFSKNVDELSLKMYSISGKVVNLTTNKLGDNYYEVVFQNAMPGIYMLEVQVEGKTDTYKLIKK